MIPANPQAFAAACRDMAIDLANEPRLALLNDQNSGQPINDDECECWYRITEREQG